MGDQNGLDHSPQVIGNLIGAQHIFSIEHRSFALLINDKLADGRVCEHRCNEPVCVRVESEHLSASPQTRRPPRPRTCDTRPSGTPGIFPQWCRRRPPAVEARLHTVAVDHHVVRYLHPRLVADRDPHSRPDSRRVEQLDSVVGDDGTHLGEVALCLRRERDPGMADPADLDALVHGEWDGDDLGV